MCHSRCWIVFSAWALVCGFGCNNDAGALPHGSMGADAAGSSAPRAPAYQGDAGASALGMQLAGNAPDPNSESCSDPELAARAHALSPIAGVYAVQVDLDAFWHDEVDAFDPRLDPGRGTIRIALEAELGAAAADGNAAVRLRTCALRLPPQYMDASGGVVQLRVDDAVWDGEAVPYATSVVPASELLAGRLDFDAAAVSFGIDLRDQDADWPTYQQTPFVECAAGRGTACFPDQDRDAHPGITFEVQLQGQPPQPSYARRGGWRYVPMPIDPSPVTIGSGAVQLYAALRTQLSGSDATCGGAANVEGAAQDAIMLRVADCGLDSGSPCSAPAADFVDQSAPVFHVLHAGEQPPAAFKHPRAAADAELDRSVSAGPRISVLRLADDAAELPCSEVRRALQLESE